MTASDLIPRQIATDCPTCRGQGLVLLERWGGVSIDGSTTRPCRACVGTGRTERLETPVEIWRRAATERGMRPPHVGSSWDEIAAELALDVIELVDRVAALEQPVRVSYPDADGAVRIDYRGVADRSAEPDPDLADAARALSTQLALEHVPPGVARLTDALLLRLNVLGLIPPDVV